MPPAVPRPADGRDERAPARPATALPAATVLPGVGADSPQIDRRLAGRAAERTGAFAPSDVAAARLPRVRRETGLNPGGVALVLGVLAGVGAAVDLVVRGSLGWCFAVLFAVGSGYTALRVQRSRMRVALVAPPLAFAVAAVAAGLVMGNGRGGPVGAALELGQALALGAPFLYAGELLAGLVLLLRRRRR